MCCNLALSSLADRLVFRSSAPTSSLFNLLTFVLGTAGLADLAVPHLLSAVSVELALFVAANALIDALAVGCDTADAMRKRRAGVLDAVEMADRVVGTVARGLLGTTGSVLGGLAGSALYGRDAPVVGAMAGSAVGWSAGWIAGRLFQRHWRLLLMRLFDGGDHDVLGAP